MRLLAVGLILLVALAGCAGSTSQDPNEAAPEPEVWAAPDWAIHALANDPDHDHGNWTHHEGRTTPNFRTLGHDALVTDRAGGTSGGYLCGEVAVDLEGRRIAVTQSHFDDVALVVADVTNATAPKMLAELVIDGFSTYDAAISDDARYALIAVSGGPATSLLDVPADPIPVRLGWRNACGETFSPIVKILPTSSVILVDLADPTEPLIVDQALVPSSGVHSVSAATIDGTHYVAASSTGGVSAASNFVFFTIEEDENLGPTLRYYGIYDGINLQSQDMGYGVSNLHTDATLQKHPLTGQVLAYLASWDGGLIIVELVERGIVTWQGDWGARGITPSETFQIHSTTPLPELWGDRHITIIGEETITPRTGMPTGLVLVIDTTDPSDPVEVARWTLPTDLGGWDASLIYSPHYIDAIGQTVFVSMYHGGVWAFDASPEHWPYPPSVGVYIPSIHNPQAPPPRGGWAVMSYAPVISEVVALEDGTMITFDSRGGIYTYRYDQSDHVEPVASWFQK